MPIENLTPFGAVCMPFINLTNQDTVLVVVAGCFRMPAPGSLATDAPLALSAEQPLVPLGDSYVGEPGRSSLRWEGQAGCERAGTDIYLHGNACAASGTTVRQIPISVRVGHCERQAMVFGDRTWQRGLWGLRPSDPVPFARMPLLYERCFGGQLARATREDAAAADRNPVGCGLYENDADAVGRPLPNLEDPTALIRSPADRPLLQGFGPVARGWMPRRSFAGSYDATWVAERAPLWPTDVDPRFLSAAAPGLFASPHLQGGEEVVLTGLHPSGTVRFRLPYWPLVAKFRFVHRTERRRLRLDAILLEPDDLAVTLIWRTSVSASPSMLQLSQSIVRVLQPGEQSPDHE